MRRREFIALFGGTAATWPFGARAQHTPRPVIGFRNPASIQAWGNYVDGFRAGLEEVGYIDGHNVTIDFCWADGHYERLPGMAADLVRRGVAVLVATGGASSASAAKEATSTIPIVFTTGVNPVQFGLVTSFNRPGGNITGVNLLARVLEGKRLCMLRALVPGVPLIAVLLNPDRSDHMTQVTGIQEAARAIGQQLQILLASNETAINAAFATAMLADAGAMLVAGDPFFNSMRDKIVALAARHSIPAIYEQREHALAGGLMSFGTDLMDDYREAGVYTGRILKGEKLRKLPVVQATKFKFVINLETARTLGIKVPPNLHVEVLQDLADFVSNSDLSGQGSVDGMPCKLIIQIESLNELRMVS